MSDLKKINTGVRNYYGCVVFVEKEDGKYYLELECYGSIDRLEVSEEFFNACLKEFGNE